MQQRKVSLSLYVCLCLSLSVCLSLSNLCLNCTDIGESVMAITLATIAEEPNAIPVALWGVPMVDKSLFRLAVALVKLDVLHGCRYSYI